MTVTVRLGDSRDVLATLAENSVDACVSDPPYALESIVKRFGKEGAAPATGRAFSRIARGFMGQTWDTGDTAFDPDFWALVYRALKPGAHLLAFGGTRTYHRLACAIEDAGFEIRDMFAWLYGSGMPKTSKDLARAIDQHFGVKGAKPPGAQQYEAAHELAKAWEGWGTAAKPALEPICFARKPLSEPTLARNVLLHATGGIHIATSRVITDDGDLGRWPANVQHDGSPEVIAAFPVQPEKAVGPRLMTRNAKPNRSDGYGMDKGEAPPPGLSFGDGGSVARFFYSAKADDEDRMGSEHPTVKPVDLMRHYVALVTPPGGLVLDPFAGTGSTGLAALGLGLDALLIEREPSYVADIERRLAWARGGGRVTALEKARDLDPSKAQGHDLPLFGGAV